MTPRFGSTAPLATPLYTSAVYTIPDLDALDEIYQGKSPGFIYARDAHPNAHALAAKLATLESGAWGLVCGSGMASLSAAFLGLVHPGHLILASDRLYGRTTQLLNAELRRFQVDVEFVDVCNPEAVRSAMQRKPKVLFVETMSNPLCRVPDLPALAELCRPIGCTLVVDNTFATPVLCKPLDLGADVVMESLTKMIAGHSDVTLGFLAGREKALLEKFTQKMTIWGLSGSPFDCWQAERGLETLEVRMRAATSNAEMLAEGLAAQPGVSRVVYPGLASHPDHAVASRLFPEGCGNMLCIELAGGREAVNRFMRNAPSVPFSPSLGHTRTTISHPASTSHRYDTPASRQQQGITDGLIRVSVGCENFEDLIAEMQKGITIGY